jgi:DNA polymerase III sliding clamp (beta) subunit (PCNA family)
MYPLGAIKENKPIITVKYSLPDLYADDFENFDLKDFEYKGLFLQTFKLAFDKIVFADRLIDTELIPTERHL